jgi:O-antigen/teichoic acid export membrane protein
MREQGNPRQPRARRSLTARTAAVTAASQVVARVSTLVFTVAATAIVARTIGKDGFADWGTVLMLTAMVAFLLDPGLAPVVVRRLALGESEAPSPESLLGVRLALSAAAFVAVVVLGLALRGSGVVVLAIVLAAQLFPRAVVLNAGTWMQAEHRLHVQTGLEAITIAGGLALLVPAAALGAPPAVLAAVGVLLPSAVLATLMWRELETVPRTPSRGRLAERGLVRAVLREAAPLAGAVLLVSLYTRIGVVFVNEAKNGAEVADFTFAFLFIEQAIVVAVILAATLLPMLVERGVGESGARPALVGDMLSLVTFIGTLGALALIALARPLVLLIGGNGLEGAVQPLTLLAPACAALFANCYMGYAHVAARRAGRYLAFNLVGLAISVVLGFALTLEQGADGAARVTWITETVVVLLAAGSFLWGSAQGRSALVHLVVTLGVVTVCAELASAGTLAPAVAGLGGLVLTLLVSLPRARGWLGYARTLLSREAVAPPV